MSDNPFVKTQRQLDSAYRSINAAPTTAGVSWVDGFFESAVSGVKELFGADPSPEAEVFRAQNPLGGIASEFLGPVGVYGAAFKGSKTIGTLKKVTDKAYDLAGGVTAPKKAAAFREMVRFAPVEVARLGTGALMYPENLGELFQDVALNQGLTAVFGAGAGFFEAAGRATAAPKGKLPAGVDLSLKRTFQLRQAREKAAQGLNPADYDQGIGELEREVFTEGPESGASFIGGTFELGKNEAAINGLFKVGNKPSMTKRLLVVDPKSGFESPERLQEIAAKAAIDLKADAPYMRFPRWLEAKNDEAAKRIQGTLTNSMIEAQPGIWYAKVRDDLFVVAKKADGEIGRVENPIGVTPTGRPKRTKKPDVAARAAAKGGDGWLLFQTDDPARFAPIADRHRRLVISEAAKVKEFRKAPLVPSGSILKDELDNLVSTISYNSITKDASPASLAAVARKLLGKQGERLPDDSPIVQGIKRTVIEKLLPSTFQEGQDLRFGRALGLGRVLMERAQGMAQRLVYGRPRLQAGKGLHSASLGFSVENREFAEGVLSMKGLFDTVSDDDVAEAMAAAYRGIKPEEIAEAVATGALSSNAGRVLTSLKTLDDWNVDQIQKAIQTLEDPELEKLFKPLETYYMFPRMYKGTLRTEVVDENGVTLALASGTSTKMAQAEADRIVDAMKADGLNVRVGKTFTSDSWDDPTRLLDPEFQSRVRRAVTSAITPPRSFDPRTGMKGTPDYARYTKDEILKGVYEVTHRKHQFLADRLLRKKLGDELRILAQDKPWLLEEFDRRMGDFIGKQGPLNNTINKAADTLLAPALGKNSASRIAAAVNGAVYWLQLGFFNPTFAALNILTPIQTVLPHLSFIMKAPPAEVERLMGWYPVIGQQGAVGQMAHISPLKLMWRAFQEMGNPDPDLRIAFERGLTDGKIDSKLFEEFAGQNSRTVQNFRGAFASGNWLDVMKATVSFLPQKSEVWSRAYAFTASHVVGRDVLGLKGDALYQFAARQTDLTMFNYATVDRARLITGPFGSMLGLFKNWQMHYMGMMAAYAGVGMRHNVWGPLAWQGAATTTLAGMGGTPYGAAVNGFAKWALGDGFDATGEDWNEGSNDALWYGLPAFLGVSLQASGSMPGADVTRDASMFFSMVHLDRGAALGRALGDSWSHWTNTGENPLRNQNIRDEVLRAVAPRAVYRAASVTEGDYIRSMSTGYPLIRDVGTFHRYLYGIGFNPVVVEKQFKLADALRKNEEAMRAAVQNYGAQYAEATRTGDFRGASLVLTRATAQGVPLDRVMASAAARNERFMAEDIFDRFPNAVQAQFGVE